MSTLEGRRKIQQNKKNSVLGLNSALKIVDSHMNNE